MTEVEMTELGMSMERELFSQPNMWSQAADMRSEWASLPADGERVAVVGCGTSWFMAQAYAELRESRGAGETDAFAASEMPPHRHYDAVVAITRSGTTTEVLELLGSVSGQTRKIGLVGDTHSPLVSAVDTVIAFPFADETSVVQTRFATTVLAFLRAASGHNLSAAIDDAARALHEHLDESLVRAEQFTFLGSGWTIGIAHEAALKMREASQSWTESYPAKEYRHGPLAIAMPGRVTWMFGDAPPALALETGSTGARFENSNLDPMADLIRVQRIALDRARRLGLDPDRPRNLTRSVVLAR